MCNADCSKIGEAAGKRVETSTHNYLVQLGCRGIWPGLPLSLTISISNFLLKL